jgi:hypothetical protein
MSFGLHVATAYHVDISHTRDSYRDLLKTKHRPPSSPTASPRRPRRGCPGTTPDGSSFNGSTCVTSPELVDGATYTVTFPTAGNFKFVCLVHSNQTGAVHVLQLSETLPYDQAFYDSEADRSERSCWPTALVWRVGESPRHSGFLRMKWPPASARIVAATEGGSHHHVR